MGGKADNLEALARAGLTVPRWFVATADGEDLLRRFDEEFGPGALAAVRSSVAGEDSSTDSFAGQMETYLFVRREELRDRVRQCLASAEGPRAAAYRKARGLAAPVRAAAVVQLMVESRVSGVLFTAHPATGDRGEAVVSAGYGLGEGVVADRVETDTFFVDVAARRIRERVIHEKTSRVVFDRRRGGGTRIEEVPAGDRLRPALTDTEVLQLADAGRRIQDLFGAPQDIEWAFDAQGKLHFLQARPITALDREQIFDNSNIVESYPGISSPLTFSFACAAYEATFAEALRRFGTPEPAVAENRAVLANLLALIDGRIYYNILNWYRLFQLVPGFERMLPAWEKALGLPARHARRGRARFTPAVLWRLFRQWATLPRSVRRFRKLFDEVHADFRRRDPATMTAHELLELYESLARRLLGAFGLTVVNDLYAQQFYDRLGKLVKPPELRNDLLCGETGMESVEPVRSMLALAAKFRAGVPDWETLRGDPDVRKHLELYGDRTVHELKLETPPLDENPEFFLSMLRNYVRGGQDVAAMERRERDIRQAAEAAAGRSPRRWIFSFVLAQTRKTVKYRENLRLARTRAFGMVKRIFRALGRIFASKGLLEVPADVFFLTVEEVAGHIRGHAATQDLRALVSLRKREYDVFARRNPPGRIVTHGPVSLRRPEERPEEREEGDVLRGIGCSPGRVRGKALVVLAPERGLEVRGEILVAPMTDPGWVFLMVSAGGLVVERGSILSHTAIIGRELGIPTVVGVKGATRLVREGEEIEIDGQAGTVRR